jgi:hypothetical protein
MFSQYLDAFEGLHCLHLQGKLVPEGLGLIHTEDRGTAMFPAIRPTYQLSQHDTPLFNGFGCVY